MSLTTSYPRGAVRGMSLLLMLVVEYFALLEEPRDFEGGGNEL